MKCDYKTGREIQRHNGYQNHFKMTGTEICNNNLKIIS